MNGLLVTYFCSQIKSLQSKFFYIFNFFLILYRFYSFLWIFNPISIVKSCPISNAFPVNMHTLTSGQWSFSHPLNPDWPIPISVLAARMPGGARNSHTTVYITVFSQTSLFLGFFSMQVSSSLCEHASVRKKMAASGGHVNLIFRWDYKICAWNWFLWCLNLW